MFETFDDHRSRYASGGIVQTLPGELIDSIWLIIDLDLKGFIPLTNLLTFEVQNNHGRVTLLFSQVQSQIELGVDLPYRYSDLYPQKVYVYDDGQRQTILLPSETR
ncbi:hypothetical protein IGI82_003117 [Enterococcus sp. AZ067]|uniref:DUF960 domain-containing protein n=1 Tax=Enterococcus sp. AZ067 TaxID=2774674 RepID=UPI000ED2BD57|nr:GTP cyclohydrolase [Enterococcus sp.]